MKPTFTDQLRRIFKGILDPTGAFLNRSGLTPNAITLLGLAGTTVGAYILSQGYMTIGGIVLFVSVLVDALDGTMARLRGEPSDFGGFVDSVSDRYAEFITFGGLLYFFLTQADYPGVVATFLATAGSVLVSYVKARAEGLGFTAKVGLLTRVERYIVLIPLLIFNQPFLAVVFIAVLGNITALQRILHVRAQGRERMKKAKENKEYLH
ncbi:MAG TPA: CDP-alcohol phosphatidyltransferase family protein [Anaerolineales bacterium]|nr:CDP-alcohol phosphatidyltransferase family protein [Anaerolineales bacterium]HMV95132.1 CDP-alcohol phosphatidyltransferase family protein [Anaerolineales bacterium]HMX18318.1 CDP-alcohol phosphatidyltransferase family protein [Anaerolineales bacterium]HMX72784.1 CDP-alcohol phosphatidyltransferase family protein [Anaerolineales bacterium]HMZ41804.1 CDP-alcohol phosphatidyltransferase family protein [Anaerolineales bacterium]